MSMSVVTLSMSLCLLLLCIHSVFVCSLYVHPVYHTIGTNITQVLSGVRMNSPTFRQGNVSFNVTAPLLPWFESKSHSPFDSCELRNSAHERERVEGKLLFITLPEVACFKEILISQCQQFKCAGVVMGSENNPAGLVTWSNFKGGVDDASLKAPFVDIRFVDSCFVYTVYPSDAHVHLF